MYKKKENDFFLSLLISEGASWAGFQAKVSEMAYKFTYFSTSILSLDPLEKKTQNSFSSLMTQSM